MLSAKYCCSLALAAMLVTMVLSGCGDAPDTSSQPAMNQPSHPATSKPVQVAVALPSYELVQDKSFSDPGATKIIWDIVVPKTVTRQSLTALLDSLYEREKAEHSNAVVISIYAYADKAHQEEGMGRWLAWLMTNDGLEKAPTIQYDDKQISGLNREETVRFGKTEEDRKEIYKKYMAVGDNYPSDGNAQERELNRMVKTLHLTRKQLDAIGEEGEQKKWVMPAMPQSSN